MGLVIRAALWGFGIWTAGQAVREVAGGVKDGVGEGGKRVASGIQVAIVLGTGLYLLSRLGKK